MSKLLLIGQAPNSSGDTSRPCLGQFMRRLCDAAEISERLYLERFERRNLLSYYPGRAGKGDAFPMAEARSAAADMDVRGRTVVACGLNVARAFGLRCSLLDTAEHRGGFFLVIPHPSGVSRWWNDPENRRRFAETLGNLFRGAF